MLHPPKRLETFIFSYDCQVSNKIPVFDVIIIRIRISKNRVRFQVNSLGHYTALNYWKQGGAEWATLNVKLKFLSLGTSKNMVVDCKRLKAAVASSIHGVPHICGIVWSPCNPKYIC